MTLTIGTRIRDNDPRDATIIKTISAFIVRKNGIWTSVAIEDATHVLASVRPGEKTGQTWVRLDRIHTDGKPRKSGWSVVE